LWRLQGLNGSFQAKRLFFKKNPTKPPQGKTTTTAKFKTETENNKKYEKQIMKKYEK
jgi:hypothetical protein